MIIPKYLETFKCIGGICEDNCCIGWDVDIDKSTYLKYKNVSHPQMRKELDKFIHKNEYVYDETVNYAFAVLNEKKECSFLNADRLCMIHKHLGESYLSNVCNSYPRMTNKVDQVVERSATPSCPEIARLLLLDPHAMTMVDVQTPNSLSLVTYNIHQGDRNYKNTLISQLAIIRDTCLGLFQIPNATIDQSFWWVGTYILELRKMEHMKTFSDVNAFSMCFLAEKQNGVETDLQMSVISGENKLDFFTFAHFVKDILRASGTSDSESYTLFSNQAMTDITKEGAQKYNDFFIQHPHMMKNLFANQIFKSLFPFSEGENMEEAYWLMVSRYAVIKLELLGLASNTNAAFNTADILSYIQSFSKVIEHHKHFEDQLIQGLKKKKYRTKLLLDLFTY